MPVFELEMSHHDAAHVRLEVNLRPIKDGAVDRRPGIAATSRAGPSRAAARQAQKMDAVDAGAGVAHDINNLLR
jgi:hypothetical protein